MSRRIRAEPPIVSVMKPELAAKQLPMWNQDGVHEHLLTESEHILTELGLAPGHPLMLNTLASARKLVVNCMGFFATRLF